MKLSSLKSTLLLVIFLSISSSIFAQKTNDEIVATLTPANTPTVIIKDSLHPCYWKYSGLYSLQTTQTGYYHWADGGENSLTLNAFANFASTYNKDRWLFDNYITLAYALTSYADNDVNITDIKKMDDKIDLGLTGGYKINATDANWYYSAMFSLVSQFDNGYDYTANPQTDEAGNIIYNKYRKIYPLKSSFFSPATMNLALGVTYKYKDVLTVLLSPFSGSLIVVADDRLTYVKKDENGNIIDERSTAGVEAGKHTKWGAGLLTEIRWKQPLNKAKTIDVDSKLRISNNYLDKRVNNRWNFDVYGQFNLNFAISKVFSTSLRLECIYDDDIMITYKKGDNPSYESPALQFKEIIGIGLAYKLVQK